MTRNQPFHESQLLDFHTHRVRHEDDTGVQEIVSLHLGEQHQKAHEYFTIGMHPWWTDQPASNVQQEELGRLLRHPNCLALGEIGLDKLKGPDMSVQLQVFRSLLAIALEFHQPVIIHCVRAFDQLLRVKKAFPEMEKWCIHGYGRHVTLARQLIDQGFYLSSCQHQALSISNGLMLCPMIGYFWRLIVCRM